MRPRSGIVVVRFVAVVALALAAVAEAAEAERPFADLDERAEVRLLTLRVRIRPTWSAPPGACLVLGAADLEVRLRGERVDAARVELDRRRERTVHALLLDTSGSMADSMDRVREAAAQYVARLDPERERALIVTFDDSVLLQRAATADRDELLDAIAAIRPADGTSLHDGLYYTVHELTTERERAVIVLLTDGYDTSSLHERDDVTERVAAHPDLTIFPIGFNLPDPFGAGPSGLASIRKFLQDLAYRTSGKYIVAPTESRLDDAFRRIREMLDSEAVLRIEDPEPGAAPGKLSVSSRFAGCRVDVLREAQPVDDPARSSLERPFPELPYAFDVPPDRRYQKNQIFRAFRGIDPLCSEGEPGGGRDDMSPEAAWHATAGGTSIDGCLLDVTMDLGLLYDPWAPSSPIGWSAGNAFLETRTRPFDVEVPSFAELPDRPERVAERLSVLALRASRHEIERDSRRKPIDWHARPYHDLPAVVHGRTFFDLRVDLAQALFAHPDYRRFALGALRAEVERDLEELRERYRSRAPHADPAAIETAVLESEDGRAIRARADRPAPTDLARILAAWLGDLPAHELFVKWESARLDELLAGQREPAAAEEFVAHWRALRDVLFVPSYARELTLLVPVHDRRRERVGFYRVVLPRVGWMLPRLADYDGSSGWSDLPFDLLPELPLVYRAMEGILDERPALAAHLERAGYRVRSLEYESRMRPRNRTPRRAFRESRAVLVLEAARSSVALELDMILDDDTAEDVQVGEIRASCEGDPALADLFRALESAEGHRLADLGTSRHRER